MSEPMICPACGYALTHILRAICHAQPADSDCLFWLPIDKIPSEVDDGYAQKAFLQTITKKEPICATQSTYLLPNYWHGDKSGA